MKFNEMLVMVGPAGVACQHSILCPVSGRALNNHWVRGANGTLVARGASYTRDYKVGSMDDYKSGLAKPHLLTIKEGRIVNYEASPSDIEQEWEVVDTEEAVKAFSH